MPADELNLDLIQMVQNARMLHDESAVPSTLPAVYWIEAKRPPGDYPAPTAYAGEWRVRLAAEAADALWQCVKALTVAGELGYKAKISTAASTDQAAAAERLLCVRTYDARDRADVERVKRALMNAGLRELEYRPDKD